MEFQEAALRTADTQEGRVPEVHLAVEERHALRRADGTAHVAVVPMVCVSF